LSLFSFACFYDLLLLLEILGLYPDPTFYLELLPFLVITYIGYFLSSSYYFFGSFIKSISSL